MSHFQQKSQNQGKHEKEESKSKQTKKKEKTMYLFFKSIRAVFSTFNIMAINHMSF